jgi:hypothetical protein
MATYATLAELKVFMRTTSTDDDALLTLALQAATDAVDLACGTTTVQFSPVPAEVKLATELQASRWAKRRDAPFGVAGSPELGSELRILAKLDPDVEILLGGNGELERWGTVG